MPGYPQFDVTLHTLTNLPCDCRKYGRNARVTEIVPNRLTLHALSYSSNVVHSAGAYDGIIPALFTTPQIPEIQKRMPDERHYVF
jgi:hypothetical protein